MLRLPKRTGKFVPRRLEHDSTSSEPHAESFCLPNIGLGLDAYWSIDSCDEPACLHPAYDQELSRTFTRGLNKHKPPNPLLGHTSVSGSMQIDKTFVRLAGDWKIGMEYRCRALVGCIRLYEASLKIGTIQAMRVCPWRFGRAWLSEVVAIESGDVLIGLPGVPILQCALQQQNSVWAPRQLPRRRRRNRQSDFQTATVSVRSCCRRHLKRSRDCGLDQNPNRD